MDRMCDSWDTLFSSRWMSEMQRAITLCHHIGKLPFARQLKPCALKVVVSSATLSVVFFDRRSAIVSVVARRPERES